MEPFDRLAPALQRSASTERPIVVQRACHGQTRRVRIRRLQQSSIRTSEGLSFALRAHEREEFRENDDDHHGRCKIGPFSRPLDAKSSASAVRKKAAEEMEIVSRAHLERVEHSERARIGARDALFSLRAHRRLVHDPTPPSATLWHAHCRSERTEWRSCRCGAVSAALPVHG